ncbi:36680_t:CDS:2, partial [Racocetra persica]
LISLANFVKKEYSSFMKDGLEKVVLLTIRNQEKIIKPNTSEKTKHEVFIKHQELCEMGFINKIYKKLAKDIQKELEYFLNFAE